MTPMEKLLSFKEVSNYLAIFPIMNLDIGGANMQIFFHQKNHSLSGADVLTNDLCIISWILLYECPFRKRLVCFLRVFNLI